jgi:hypothetical protein
MDKRVTVSIGHNSCNQKKALLGRCCFRETPRGVPLRDLEELEVPGPEGYFVPAVEAKKRK